MVGFPITLALVSMISLIGVVLVRDGLSHPKPLIENETETTLISKEVPAE
ncbi:MAG: hypothetical protein GF411_11835 [Candidatus Lokiarchaeota archaeon]|nr:hypothetical protein [Candidatus Lokiarchaeota archaeon]